MTLKQPASMEECIYFTNRSIGKGKARAWVLKNTCTKCNQGLIGKPKNPKTGRPKIRSQEYSCPNCNYTLPKEEYEDTLTCSIQYTCPFCSYEGEAQVPFKRKKVQILNEETMKKKAAEAIRFKCEKCNKDIDLTKKMK